MRSEPFTTPCSKGTLGIVLQIKPAIWTTEIGLDLHVYVWRVIG